MRSVLRRPALLLSAAVTITVPGALSALAVLGHQQHESTVSSAQTASGVPLPSARTMIPASVSRAQARERARGSALLRQAADAGRSATYQGVESLADTTVAGPSTIVARVWHQGGGVTVMQMGSGHPERAYDSDGRAPEGVLGVTPTMVGLMEKQYVPVYMGTGTAAGRPALIVAVQRADGSTAARYWLDARTRLPLRRDLYGASARVASDERFTRVTFATTTIPGGGPRPRGAGWVTAPSPARLLSELNGSGCPLPRVLPGNLSLYAASQARTSTGRVDDFGFSDGLLAVSLFVERGSLPRRMPGWRAERISGHLVYVTQHEVAMSGRGFVYTLVSDAPPPTVDAVVGALPPTGSPGEPSGILDRMGRGLDRLVSVLNPFR